MQPLLSRNWMKNLFGRMLGLYRNFSCLLLKDNLLTSFTFSLELIFLWCIFYLILNWFFVNSTFSEIFDVDWFISLLKYDVKIVKEIPKKGGKTVAAPYTMRVPRKCTPKCYQSRVLPALMKKHVSTVWWNFS